MSEHFNKIIDLPETHHRSLKVQTKESKRKREKGRKEREEREKERKKNRKEGRKERRKRETCKNLLHWSMNWVTCFIPHLTQN